MCNAKNCASTCARRIKYESALDRLEAKYDIVIEQIDDYDRLIQLSPVCEYPLEVKPLVNALKAKRNQITRVYTWLLKRLHN